MQAATYRIGLVVLLSLASPAAAFFHAPLPRHMPRAASLTRHAAIVSNEQNGDNGNVFNATRAAFENTVRSVTGDEDYKFGDWTRGKNTGDFKWRTGWHSFYCQATCNLTLAASFPPHPSRPTRAVCSSDGVVSDTGRMPWCSMKACNAPKGQGYAKPYGNRSTPYCDSFVCCDVAACKLGWLGLGAAR